jgi:3-oxoadipate enol-lactonase
MPYAIGPQGTRIHYRVVGDRGPNVVLIQGIGLSSRFWFEQPDLLAQHEKDPYRVLLVDNRGTGRSDAPRGLYFMRHMADDVLAAMVAAEMPSAILVGISMGGMIAQHVALRHPSHVNGLVLLATTAGLPYGRLPGATAIATLLALALEPPRLSRGLAKLLLPAKHIPRRRELMAEWPAAFKENPMPRHAFLGQFAAVMGHSTGWRLRKIRCPTVVVTGDDDILVPAINSELLARRIPNAALEVIPETGHGIPILDRDVVRRALDRVRTLPPRAEMRR